MIRAFLLSLLLAAFAWGIPITEDPSFKSIFAQKQNADRTVLMMYTAQTCPQCAYMKQKVFKAPEVKEYLDKHFVVLEKDVNRDDLPEGFDYFGIPTIFFVDRNGVQIGTFIGSARAEPFLETLRGIVKESE